MSTYRLGRIGLVLLGLYLVVECLAIVAEALSERVLAFSDPSPPAMTLVLLIAFPIAILNVVLTGVLPASLLIKNRDRLARRWFAEDGDPPVAISTRALLKIGLVLLGVSTLVSGMVGVLGTFVAAVAFEAQTDGGAGVELAAVAIQSIVTIAAGAALVRFAKPMSKQWAAEKDVLP